MTLILTRFILFVPKPGALQIYYNRDDEGPVHDNSLLND